MSTVKETCQNIAALISPHACCRFCLAPAQEDFLILNPAYKTPIGSAVSPALNTCLILRIHVTLKNDGEWKIFEWNTKRGQRVILFVTFHLRKVFCPVFRYSCSTEEENWRDAGNATIRPSHVMATIIQPPPPTIVHNIHRLLLYRATEVIHATQSKSTNHLLA